MSVQSEKGMTVGSTKLERVANITTILVSLLLSAVLVKQFLLPQARPGPPTAGVTATKGTSLKGSLPGVDWAKNGRSLILAISTRCHFCTDSAPFFKRIAREKPAGTKLLAVLPQAVEEARIYLDQEGVRVDDVRQAPLDSIKVSGTPTLLLVDNAGTVADVWVGKLEPSQEEDVLRALRKN
jgi:hypothetical protein